ncbi:hypothetical protein [Lactobacillus equicursoris]|nr:hypothetical protein [Lactobacillus equicursoris]
MMTYQLVYDNEKERQYKVEGDCNALAYVTIDKVAGTVSSVGTYNIMFGKDFTEKLALGTLKFKNNPPKEFTYGVG